MSADRFPIRFTGANPAMGFIGWAPSSSEGRLDGDHVHVRMGWAFALTFPRSAVRHVGPDEGLVTGWGVHGWRGSWLVNGSSGGLVRVELSPPSRARLLLFSVKVRVLRVAVEDPAGLIAALNDDGGSGTPQA
jgi:hypothetical protein